MKNKILVDYTFNSYDESKNRRMQLYFEYDEHTTFGDLMRYLDAPSLMVITKNAIEGEKLHLSNFDYILGKNEVFWNNEIVDTKITDYLYTFECKKLFVSTVEGIGGLDFFTLDMTVKSIQQIIKFLWDNREIITYVYTLYEITNHIIAYVKKKSENEEIVVHPIAYFHSILCKNDWVLSDFSVKYDLDEKKAAAILELLGYCYDAKKDRYHITQKKRESVVHNIEQLMNEDESH